MNYRWKGPATSIEVWSPDYSAAVFSGFVVPDDVIAVPLDEDSEQVKGWLAFGLIEAVADASSDAKQSGKTGKKGDADNG